MAGEAVADDRPTKGGIQVIARAAAVLRALGPEPMSLGAIANETGLPRSTVQRIVDALAAEHFVEADRNGVRPGWGLQRLSMIGEVDIVAAVRPHLEWLFEQTRETVDFSMAQGREVVFLDRILSDQTLRVVPMRDRPRSLHVMANGKSILSSMTDEDIEKLFSKQGTGASAMTPANLKKLLAEIASVRQTGFSYDHEGYAEGVHAIGVPVEVCGLRPYALSVAAPTVRFDTALAKLKSALKECKKRVERELTHLGSAPAR